MLISTCLNFLRLRHEQHLCECGNFPTGKKGWGIHAGVLHMFHSWLVEWKGAMKEKLICELKSSKESFYHTAWNLVVDVHQKIYSSNSMMHFTALASRMGLSRNGMHQYATWCDSIGSLTVATFIAGTLGDKYSPIWELRSAKYGNVCFPEKILLVTCHCHLIIWYFTKIPSPKLTAPPENRPIAKREVVFQPSIFRCKLLVSRRVKILKWLHQNAPYQSLPFWYVFRACHWRLKQNRFMHLVLQMVGNSFPAPTKTTSNVKQRQFWSTLMEVKVELNTEGSLYRPKNTTWNTYTRLKPKDHHKLSNLFSAGSIPG